MTGFTEADVRAGTTSPSFGRGDDYYRQGAVSDVTRRGNLLTAQVQGSDYSPYQISVTLTTDGGIGRATCDCPYSGGGYCKHIVAVLLTVLQADDEITVKPELDTLLAGLTDTQLRRVIRAVAEDRPAFADAIEQEVRWLTMTPAAGSTGTATPVAHSIAVDITAIRREMRKDFRRVASMGGSGYSSDYYDDDAGTIDPDDVLQPHYQMAEALLAAGDAAAATDVVTAMIEEWGAGISDLDEWIREANEYAFDEAAQALGALLAEALLSQDLSEEQQDQWMARVQDWGEDLIDLAIAETALTQWWDDPLLVAAMEGNVTERGVWEGTPPEFADELTLVRLHILERQGRVWEYIHLAEAEGQTSLYVNMLARSGQVERAVAEARQLFHSPTQSLSLAHVLAGQGERAATLAVAAHGLDLAENTMKKELARWTVVQAQEAGDAGLALRAAQVAFLNSFELADYQVVEQLAGPAWPAIKPGLLVGMEQSRAYPSVDVYLYEKMLVEAMAAVDQSPYSRDLERVIQATRAQYPDWGIKHYRRQAEGIMNAGKADAYRTAAPCLRSARDIYLQHNRQPEWQAYLTGLLDVHARKYKLVPLLRELR